MLRLGLPAVCCAALLWCRSEAAPAPRAERVAWAAGAADLLSSGAGDPDPGPSPTPEPPAAVRQPPIDDSSPAVPPEPDGLRQHDVRDLVGMGFTIEEIAFRVEYNTKAGSVTARTNVLEVLAPEETQLQVERFLEEKRRIGTCVLRIHPVADLVMPTEEYEQLQASLRQGTSIPAEAFEEPPEPAQPFEVDSLVEVILQTLGEGVRSITPQGRNLVVLAEPAAHARIADFLDDLRSNVEAESG